MNNAYYKAWPEELRGQPWILPVQYSYTRMVNRKEILILLPTVGYQEL